MKHIEYYLIVIKFYLSFIVDFFTSFHGYINETDIGYFYHGTYFITKKHYYRYFNIKGDSLYIKGIDKKVVRKMFLDTMKIIE